MTVIWNLFLYSNMQYKTILKKASKIIKRLEGIPYKGKIKIVFQYVKCIPDGMLLKRISLE